MTREGQALVRIAQLRGRIATLARGGRYDLAASLLGELIRADLGLGLPADALLRARQGAALASTRGEGLAGPLVVLAATLLAANAFDEARTAASAAIAHATDQERARVEVMAHLIGGVSYRRSDQLAEARILVDAARVAAARLGERELAGFALAELAWIELGEGQPAAAATCFEFAAEFLRATRDVASVEADVLSVAAWAAADEAGRARERAAVVVVTARAAKRPDLIAYLDGVLAELALRTTPEVAALACAVAVQSAQRLKGTVARELIAQARLRQVRTSNHASERARFLEVGIDLALALERHRAAARLGALLSDLLDDATRRSVTAARPEVERLAAAIDLVGDDELAEMAHAVLAELG